MQQFQSSSQHSPQLAQAEQLIQQMIQQTQQASGQYQQLMRQEQENAQMLQKLSQLEQQAVHTIQIALQGHQTAIQQLQQISSLCNQMASGVSHQVPAYTNPYTQTSGISNYSQH